MAARRRRRAPDQAWKRLRESPDYVSDWDASAGLTAREAPPRAFRRQTEADLKAARWGLLAWEDPHHPQAAELFWADPVMVEARVARSARHAWRTLVLDSGASYAGLRLLDGALVLKVWCGRETGQVRIIDGAAFNPATSGLEVATGHGVDTASDWVRIESVERILSGC